MNRFPIVFLFFVFYLLPLFGEEVQWEVEEPIEWSPEEFGFEVETEQNEEKRCSCCEGENCSDQDDDLSWLCVDDIICVEYAEYTDEDFEGLEESEFVFDYDNCEEFFGMKCPDEEEEEVVEGKVINEVRIPSASFSNEPAEDSNVTLATLEGGPSAIVGGCVNAITGDFFDAQIDLVVPGPQPLVVQRTYCSSEGKWHFRHMPKLEVGFSRGKKHLWAGYYDDTGSGIVYRTSAKDSRYTIPASVFRKGLTNTGADEISAQTNWRNTHVSFLRLKKQKKKHVEEAKTYLLRHGSHVSRLFTRYKRPGEQHKKGAPLGKFHLEREIHPNGNLLFYEYKGDLLTTILGKNAQGHTFSTLTITGDLDKDVTWKATNGSVRYHFDDKKLSYTFPSHGAPVRYEYFKDKVIEKILPQGRRLNIIYEKDKVKQLLAPVGPDNSLQPIYTFIYGKGLTKVADAANNLTRYLYDEKTKRLNDVIRYEGNAVYSSDHFIWDETHHVGNLLSRTFKGKGNISFHHALNYDQKDNVQKEQLSGNLTGNNLREMYQKNYRYSQGSPSLLLEENDGRKSITYTYAPKTNCITERLTKTPEGKILKREFFEYDVNGVVNKEIWDNGISGKKEDLSGVTERHIKYIQTRHAFPVGLPEVIVETYWDQKTNRESFLKKIENKYTLTGQLAKQKHYTAKEFAYILYWEYDPLGNITKETNALGEETHYKYDSNGNKIYEKTPTCEKFFTFDCANRLIKEEERWGDQTLITTHRYNSLNQCIATIDIYGNERTYEYDIVGKVTKKISPAVYQESTLIQSQETTEYDALGNAITITDANGNVTRKSYTIRGQPYRIEYPDGSVETKEYSLDGLLVREIGKNGLITAYTHDALGNIIRKEVRDAANQILKVTSAIYNTFHLLSETDETGLVTTYDYDGAGRCIKKTTGDHLTEYHYDSLGRLTNTKTEERVITHEYDNLNRVIEERLTDMDQVFKREQYRYDANGNRTHVIAYTQAGIATTVTEYNPRNQVTKVTDALGNVTHTTYNYNHVENGQTVLQIIQTDPLGNQEIKTHDTLGRFQKLTRRNPFNELTQQETYHYDAKGQRIAAIVTVLSKEAPRTVTTSWEYDSMGNCIRCTEAKGTAEQKETTYHYNSFGQKERIVQPNGVTLFHDYNSLGLLKELKSSDQTIHYFFTYDLKDHPTHIKDLIHGTENVRVYDQYYRLVSETLDTGHTFSYAYDPLDRLISLTFPDNTSIHYHYNAHFLTDIDRVKEGKVLYTHRYYYDLAGNVTRKDLIGQAGHIEYEHDLLGRTIASNAIHWKETIPEKGYDAAGNLTKRHVVDSQGEVTYAYTYDDLYQLTSETGGIAHLYQNDSLYNRTNKNEQPYQVNSLNQLLNQTDVEYQYDPNGNLIKMIQGDHGVEYCYDALNRLIEIKKGTEVTHYRYDSFHRRLSKNKRHYLYQGQNEIGTIQDDKIIELRILGLGHGAEIGAAVAIELQGIPYAPIHDPYGNLVMLLDLNGKPVESYRYTAFGESTSQSKLNNPWRFSSKRYDSESGFYYFGRRYYSPDVGRWITPDPIGFEDGFNLYAYVQNHPLTYIDPDGQLIWFLAPVVISLAIDYFTPTAIACINTYAGGTLLAGFATGLLEGYSGGPSSLFEGNTLQDPNLSLAEYAGKSVGAFMNLMPTKRAANVTKTTAHMAAQGTTNIATKLGNTVTQRIGSWFAGSATRKTTATTIEKTALATEKQIAKTGKKVANAAEELTKKNPNKKVRQIEETLSEWLGKDSKMFKNKAGDVGFLSRNEKRTIRFDFNRPYPHQSPHMHLNENLCGDLWNESGQIYPIDLPHY